MSIEEIEKLEDDVYSDYEDDFVKKQNTVFLAEQAKEKEADKEELEEEEAKEAMIRDFEKRVEETYAKIELEKLKLLVEHGMITEKNLRSIVQKQVLKIPDIEKIFKQIDEMAHIEDSGEYLPKDLVMKKNEYLKALSDLKARLAAIEKLNEALTYMGDKDRYDQGFLYLVSNVYLIFQHNLQLIQDSFMNEQTVEQRTERIEQSQEKFWDKFSNFFK